MARNSLRTEKTLSQRTQFGTENSPSRLLAAPIGQDNERSCRISRLTYRTLQYWVAWYRHGDLAEVLQLIKGHGNQGRPAKLNALQQKTLAAKVALGYFRNVWDAILWVRNRWKVQYSYSGLFKRLKSLTCRLKVPRPHSVKADIEAQEEWKATGLTEALHKVEMIPSHHIWFSDEMRFGLWGQTRKRWGLRSVPIIQPIQIEGEVYKSLEHKRHTIEYHLRRLCHDKTSLRQLIAWEWIREVFAQLEAPPMTISN